MGVKYFSYIKEIEKYYSKNREVITIDEYVDASKIVKAYVSSYTYGLFDDYHVYFNEEDIDYIYDRVIVKGETPPFQEDEDGFFDGLSLAGSVLNWNPRQITDSQTGQRFATDNDIGVLEYSHRLKEEGKAIPEKVQILLVVLHKTLAKTAGFERTDNMSKRSRKAAVFRVDYEQYVNTITEILEENPEIIDKNVRNFRQYYGFDAWDKRIIRVLNDMIDADSLESYTTKAYIGAATKNGDSWNYVKPGGETLSDTFKIENRRIGLVSREMWWQKPFSTDNPYSQIDKGANSKISFSNPLEKFPDKSITARFKEQNGFSDLNLDGGETGASYWAQYWYSRDDKILTSKKWWASRFAIEFMDLVEFDNTPTESGAPVGYTYSSVAAEKLILEHIFQQPSASDPDPTAFLNQRINIETIKSESFAAPVYLVVYNSAYESFRQSWWKSVAEEINANPDATNKQLVQILKDSANEDFQDADDAAQDALDDLELPPDEEQEAERLSEDEKRRRNLLLKQCALMINLPDLQKRHIDDIVSGNKEIHKKGGKTSIYQNRFYMVRDSIDEGDTVNKLLVPPYEAIKHFIEIRPEVHAHLVPKIRIYRVSKGTDGQLQQHEFIFPKHMHTGRVNKLKKDGVYDRGAEFGIKEFSFSFNGTNPATARNDIEAKLSLYFQTFNDFIVRRPITGGTMAYIDLILHPEPDTGETINASHPEFYSPKNYRIKVDVGWELSSIAELNNPAPFVTSLKTALRKTNKTFYLNRLDESINFRDDGSVQIDIDYRAYAETATKGTELDALSNHKSRKARDEVRKDFLKVSRDANCSPKQLARIQSQLEQMEELIKRQSYQSIYRRLICNESIHFAKMDRASANRSFRVGRFDRAVKLEFPDFENTDLNITLDYAEIPYFYLGDLLYVILDSLYKEDNETEYIDGTEKFKFILSSFKFENPFKAGEVGSINIASIPISNELFKEWFTDNVLNDERKFYPIMFFIRDLCTYLITEILTENCFKKSIDKKFEFLTTTFTGLGNSSGGCKMSEMYPSTIDASDVVIDLNTYYGRELPIMADNGYGNHIKNLYNYILVFANGPKIVMQDTQFKRGNRAADGSKGVFHYQIGKDRGLVKKMKFSKTDIAFLREARYLQNGYDGLAQLANKYQVTLEMIGNTIYYPGMEIYIDPVGFLGADTQQFNPSVFGSVANRLGFGGYHIITKVNSSIGPGKFTTTVEALFDYSGDRMAHARYGGAGQNLTSDLKSKPATGFFVDNCTNILDHVERNALEIADGRADEYKRISDSLINEAAAGPAAIPTPENEEEE